MRKLRLGLVVVLAVACGNGADPTSQPSAGGSGSSSGATAGGSAGSATAQGGLAGTGQAGNVATAGGCFASQYLAAWIIARTEGEEAARSALHYVAPVGEKDEYVARAMANIAPYLRNNGA